MAAALLPKSILKQPSTPASYQTKAERDREIALYHANLIQERKDVEIRILSNTEELIDLPTSKSHTAADPTSEDVRTFKTLLIPFQPSDYDSLIEERNINGHCGYTLCPNPHYTDGGKGAYRFIGKSGKAKDFKIVTREEMEKWCSEDCARRAMYIKVQLNESPAWEREAQTDEIELMNEPKSNAQRKEDQLAEDIKKLKLVDTTDEKREDDTNPSIEITIRENEVKNPVTAPSLKEDGLDGRLDTTHLTLEGHTPLFETRKRLRQDDSVSRSDRASESELDYSSDDREES